MHHKRRDIHTYLTDDRMYCISIGINSNENLIFLSKKPRMHPKKAELVIFLYNVQYHP